MSIKEELELLRGEPIRTYEPSELVPCIETSDTAQLCRHPVVTVRMITFNHAPYIRQAIESVVNQQTDFEFELLIGEDASTDGTREICFEYQRKFPDKVRVCWSEENLYKTKGNGRRLDCRCRGEFIAYCEGDDYWVDPCKLQKQVDIMWAHPNVGLCFGMMQIHYQDTGRIVIDNDLKKKWSEGVIQGLKMARSDYVIPTPTVLVRKSSLDEARKKYELLSWQFHMGDFQKWKALALISDVYCHYDLVAAYRQVRTSAMHTIAPKIYLDSLLVNIWFADNESCFTQIEVADCARQVAGRRAEAIAMEHQRNNRVQLWKAFCEVKWKDIVLSKQLDWVEVQFAKLGWLHMLRTYQRIRRGLSSRIRNIARGGI